MAPFHDIEYQFESAIDVVGVESNDPLLPKSAGASSKNTNLRRVRRSAEVIELDDIPPIIKSANGNIFWADEQCTRRVGLTSSEARLLLKLLQTDEPENYNYDEYKDMFNDFGAEQKRLQQLVDALPWWKLDTFRQKGIWQARIEWLERMREPRLWLMYLMARRRRILKQACGQVLKSLREKRRVKMMKHESPDRGRQPLSTVSNGQVQASQPIMLTTATQTPEQILETASSSKDSKQHIMISDTAQTSEPKLGIVGRLRDSLSASRRRGSHSHSSAGRCPVFTKPFEATREDIKRQVEEIMPKCQPYIVIGWFIRSANDPKERILQFETPELLFKALQKGESDLRGWRRFLSLKALRGFGLYKCDIAKGCHRPLILNGSQEAVLSQLFLAYEVSYRHADPDVARAWAGWVHKNLNNHKNNPLEGRYSLQLLYDWSSYRLSTIVAIPLLLSMAIGFWYMNGPGDVITAWTLALYIVTAAAALIALMAIIGSLKDI